jgi:Glycosyl hydrolases family 16
VLTVVVAASAAVAVRSGGAGRAELDASLVGASAPAVGGVADEPTPVTTIPPAPLAAPAARPGTAAKKAPTRTAPTPRPPASTRGDGVQAAREHGWKLVDRDEFDGTALGAKWGPYDGEGHGGDGRRSPDAISVRNGVLVIHGDANGTTGGLAYREARRFGRWEMRARFPKGDPQYHPVLLLWPADDDWPQGGEIDVAETDSAADSVSFFLHYGSANRQKSATRKVDLAQWHNYAVEWTADGVTGYLDGEKWFTSTDPGTVPPGRMQPSIQLDWFPDGGAPKPTELLVDWIRAYA